nr:hypothetical protein CFP56_78903 [Quercus suber]
MFVFHDAGSDVAGAGAAGAAGADDDQGIPGREEQLAAARTAFTIRVLLLDKTDYHQHPFTSSISRLKFSFRCTASSQTHTSPALH